jgi:nitroreductase
MFEKTKRKGVSHSATATMSRNIDRSLVQAFEIIARKRQSCKKFRKNAEIPAPILRRVLELGQLAPSSFNLQPYKMIIVRSNSQNLASAMLGSNGKTVTDASANIVILAERGSLSTVLDDMF